jgi:sensor domain CHASE-containing protein
VLGGLLLLLLISMLVVVAVFSPHRVRRGTAEKILAQLLNALTQTRQQ